MESCTRHCYQKVPIEHSIFQQGDSKSSASDIFGAFIRETSHPPSLNVIYSPLPPRRFLNLKDEKCKFMKLHRQAY